MKLVKPISEEKRIQLEQELEFQKERFFRATQISADKLQNNFSVKNWIQTFPLQTAVVISVLGFIGIQMMIPANPVEENLSPGCNPTEP